MALQCTQIAFAVSIRCEKSSVAPYRTSFSPKLGLQSSEGSLQARFVRHCFTRETTSTQLRQKSSTTVSVRAREPKLLGLRWLLLLVKRSSMRLLSRRILSSLTGISLISCFQSLLEWFHKHMMKNVSQVFTPSKVEVDWNIPCNDVRNEEPGWFRYLLWRS